MRLLAERMNGHELPAQSHRLLDVASSGPHIDQRAQCPLVHMAQPMALGVDPESLDPGEERPSGDGLGDHRFRPRSPVVTPTEGSLCAVDRSMGAVHIDAGIDREPQFDDPARSHQCLLSIHSERSEGVAKPTERRIEHRFGRWRRTLGPEIVEQIESPDRMLGKGEPGQHHPPEPTGQITFAHDMHVVAQRHSTCEGDMERHMGQGISKVERAQCPSRRWVMAESGLVVECPCGVVIREVSQERLITEVHDHARQVHDMDLDDGQIMDMAHPG